MSIQFKRILFPTDFSELALGALDYAKLLTSTFSAELYCLHVVDDAYQYWSAMGPESIPICPPPEDIVDLGRARMDKFRDHYLNDLKTEVFTHVSMGRPFSEIISWSRDQNIDLIVMGTHGRGAIAHVLLGSTTEKVVRKSPCAVMTIRASEHKFVMP